MSRHSELMANQSGLSTEIQVPEQPTAPDSYSFELTTLVAILGGSTIAGGAAAGGTFLAWFKSRGGKFRELFSLGKGAIQFAKDNRGLLEQVTQDTEFQVKSRGRPVATVKVSHPTEGDQSVAPTAQPPVIPSALDPNTIAPLDGFEFLDEPVTAIATEETYAKRTLADSSELQSEDKRLILPGYPIEVIAYKEVGAGHVAVQFLQERDTALTWNLFKNHFKLASDEPVSDRDNPMLQVLYDSQLDNARDLFGNGNRQCNTSTHAMLVNYLLGGWLEQQMKLGKGRDISDVYDNYVAQYGDTTYHEPHTKALAVLGIESVWSTSLSLEFLKRSLQAGVPVAIGMKYKKWGHINLAVGWSEERGGVLVHDPYGTRMGTSDRYLVGQGGPYDLYTFDSMRPLFCPQGNNGWGRIVTSVKGKATGL